ncbi:MAG TPA: M28 family peptidase [Candidatus Thermoplasmatota archaeon]|nr:M28 family peptidase [Candidatus Thermoplasmatota archaeon]
MRWGWLLLVSVLVAGCVLDAPAPATTPTGATPVATPSATPTAPTASPPAPTFDGARAYAHVVAQVHDENGEPRYRVPGTEGNREVARYIDATMSALGYEVSWHHFNATYGCERTPMHNIVAERAGTSGKLIVFAAHYDTRPVGDKDPDPSKHDLPILGANDGGSGVGVLLELARVLPRDTAHGVRFLFFDGEDGGGYRAKEGCRTDWILGSRAYAESLSAAELAAIDALVLVDMVGAPDLVLPREGYSAEDARAAAVQDEVYTVGEMLGHDQFLDRIGAKILDDHIPFLERQVAAIDLIHTVPGDPRVFPRWHHTHDDDLDAVSADSLAVVGETLEVWFRERASR